MSADLTPTIRAEVTRQALGGSRLDAATLTELAAMTDILALGALADDVRRQRHGSTVTFVRVHALAAHDTASWTPAPPTAGEVRLVGTPGTLDAALEAVLAARVLAGPRVVRGFTLGDLAGLGGDGRYRALAAAGLDAVALCEALPGADGEVHAAREAGLTVGVVGVHHAPADRVAWLVAVRALQDAVGGLQTVAPLARIVDAAAPTTGFDDVRRIALARLALEHVPSVQVDWAVYGPKLAQVALTVGADDLDGVAASDDATLGPRRASLADVRRNIVAAGFTPAERDGRYGRIGG